MAIEKREALLLSKAAEYLVDECRMVLPGIQTLLGFQLIAVFKTGFDQTGLWFVLPRARRLQRVISGG